MPRAVRVVASLLAIACALAPGLVHATPIPGGLQEARGTATTYQIIGSGAYVPTGPGQWSILCTQCDVFITFSDLADGVTIQDASVAIDAPGAYEFREFTGTLVFSYHGPGDYATLVVGHGEIDPQ